MKMFWVLVLVGCGEIANPIDAPPGKLDTPPGAWAFVPIDGTTCGDGSPAAIAINRAPAASSELFVYFEGGGACWDQTTCFVLKSAVRIEAPYDAAAFQSELAGLVSSPAFDRGAAANPFKAATYVYVPYCTGDLHAGTRVATYGTKQVHHTGATNAQVVVDALRASVPALTTIWLTGTSAGGYGATLNLHRFATAWPSAQLHLLQDSSPFVEVLANYGVWQAAWALAFPPSCGGCDTSFPKVIDAVTASHPTSRIALLTFRDDAVIKAFFGYSGSLAPAIDALVGTQYGKTTTHAFELDGTAHTMLGGYATLVGAGNVTLADWIGQWATGDGAWTTVKP